MSTTMIRVSKRTRDVIGVIAREDYGGVTLDEALERLAREHWQQRAIGAMDQYRSENPAAWRDYLTEADGIGRLDHEITE
jgi:hypothetical protein